MLDFLTDADSEGTSSVLHRDELKSQLLVCGAEIAHVLGLLRRSGSSIREHFHPQEEVYVVIERELEVTIDGVTQIARAGIVAIVPSNVPHSVKALTDGRAIIVDYPLRHEFV